MRTVRGCDRELPELRTHARRLGPNHHGSHFDSDAKGKVIDRDGNEVEWALEVLTGKDGWVLKAIRGEDGKAVVCDCVGAPWNHQLLKEKIYDDGFVYVP